MRALVQYSRRRKEHAKLPPARGPVAGLLGQFAGRGVFRAFVRLQRAGRDFKQRLGDDGPAVANQADVLRVHQRDNGNRTGVEDNVALDSIATGQHGGIERDLDLSPAKDDLTRHKVPPI